MATSISLSWMQSPDDSVDSYEITYSYTINQCDGVEGAFPPITISISNGTQMSYIIANGPSTPVEEDSMYTIRLTAISGGMSSDSASTQTITLTAGIYSYGLYSVLVSTSFYIPLLRCC
jgi:hypothetical protein